MNSRLPNLFIPNAGRCGTSFLNEQLAHHPDIYISVNEEPTFSRGFYWMKSPWEYLRPIAGADREPESGESARAYPSCSTSLLERSIDFDISDWWRDVETHGG